MKKIDAYMIVVGGLEQIVDLVNEKIKRDFKEAKRTGREFYQAVQEWLHLPEQKKSRLLID